MFSNPISTSNTVEEGTVIQVDHLRSLCKVRTLRGQILSSVQWLTPFGGSTRGSDRFVPAMGDRVMLDYGLGYPVIMGFFPRLQVQDGATPLEINSGEELIDLGNYSPQGAATRGDQNKPKDMLPGDRLISSIGGALLGLLRAGSVVIRSTRSAEIFMSGLRDMIRVVSRNWEHFTDVSSDVIKNFKGRIFRYTGYGRTLAQSRTEDYKLHFYYGDTAAAEAIKTTYGTFSGVPATNTIVYKEQVTDTPSTTVREIMRRTLDLTGNQEVWIYNGTHFTRVSSTAEELRISWNDQNTITVNESSIHAVHKDGADYIMDANGIRATFSDGTINMSNSNVLVEFGASTATLTNSDVIVMNGTGKLTVSPAVSKLENGSHSITITSGGVAIV